MGFNLEEPFMLPPPHSPISNRGESIPLMHFHLPFQAHTSQSKAYADQDSIEGTYHYQQVHPHPHTHTPRARSNHACFCQVRDFCEDFEPLPFWADNDSCLDDDDFANFIEGAIHQVEAWTRVEG